jgi:sugar phosphate isomerase/epimerase
MQQDDRAVDHVAPVASSVVDIGLISLDYGHWREVVAAAVQWGLPLVELFVDVSLVEEELDEVVEVTRTTGVRVSSVSSLARLAQPDTEEDLAAHLSLVHRSISMAGSIGAPFVTLMHGGSESLDRPAALERFVERLEEPARRAADVGTTLLIENVFSRMMPGDLDDVAATVEAFSALAPLGVGCNLDLGNFAVAGAVAVPDAWERLAPFTRSVHLKDVEPYVAERHGELGECRPLDGRERGRHLSVPLGEGLVDYRPVLHDLAKGRRDVPVMLEPFAGGDQRDRWIDRTLTVMAEHGVLTRR